MIGLAALFYWAADFENLSHPLAWGGASVLVYFGAGYGLHWDTCGMLMLQMGLLLIMAATIHFTKQRGGLAFWDLRKQRRLNRGLCPECGYDLKGKSSSSSDRCSECGWQRKLPS